MNKRIVIPIFLLWAALGPPWAAGARADDRVQWNNLASVLAEYDDNVYKTVNNVDGDFLARVFFDSRLDLLASPSNTMTFDYTLGAKKFAGLDDQDTLINQILAQWVNRGIKDTFLGGAATVKLRNVRDGEEDYNKVILNGFIGRYFTQGVTGRFDAAYTRFDFKNYDFYDYWTQSFGLEIKKSVSHALSFGTRYVIEDKHYPFAAFENVAADDGSVFLVENDELRVDTLHDVGVFMNSFYYVLIAFSYDLQINDSNSYGDSYYHHRLRLGLSRAVAQGTNVHLFAVANFRDSYQEVLIPHSYSIEEDDENYNQIVAKLSQRLTDRWWVELRYARFWSQYSVREFNFTKNVYSVGVSCTF